MSLLHPLFFFPLARVFELFNKQLKLESSRLKEVCVCAYIPPSPTHLGFPAHKAVNSDTRGHTAEFQTIAM